MKLKSIVTLGIITITIMLIFVLQITTDIGQPLTENTEIIDTVNKSIQKSMSDELGVSDSVKP